MNNKEKINKALEKICVSEDLDKKVMDKTINKLDKKNNFKFSYKKVILGTLVISFLMVTTVFAKDLIYKYVLNKKWVGEQYYQSISLTKPVYINDVKNYTCDNFKTLNDMENILGIKFVFDTSKYNGKINKCEIKLNDEGYIEAVNVSVKDFYDYSEDNKEIDAQYKDDFTQEEFYAWEAKRKITEVYIKFMTQYASLETKEEFKEIQMDSSNVETRNYEFYAKNINTEGYYNLTPSERLALSKFAVFVNNNILYEFYANKLVSIEDLLGIIYEF